MVCRLYLLYIMSISPQDPTDQLLLSYNSPERPTRLRKRLCRFSQRFISQSNADHETFQS
jgi:hypothetical protein